MSIREIVLKHLAAIVAEHSPVPFPDDVTDDTMLDEFWLDSVAFAALVSGLEAEVGYIPSDILEGAFYPEAVGELVAMYENTAKSDNSVLTTDHNNPGNPSPELVPESVMEAMGIMDHDFSKHLGQKSVETVEKNSEYSKLAAKRAEMLKKNTVVR